MKIESIFILYPNQLFHNFDFAKYSKNIALIEDSLFFGEKRYISNFHQNKIVLHRASMKDYFENYLKNFNSYYYEFHEGGHEKVGEDFSHLRKIFAFSPKDFLIEKRLKKFSQTKGIELEFVDNPNFLTPKEIYEEFFRERSFQMTPFYILQRRRFKIFIDSKDKPLHGKWTFDTENRKKLPKNLEVPTSKFFGNTPFVQEAKEYTKKHFSKNLGHFDNFIFPTNTHEARLLLNDFLQSKLENFGPYEDAISKNERFVFHSLLSSSINIGLLSPDEVVSKTLSFYEEHPNLIPYSSIEGFIRQIIGWREFMMIIYELEGVRERNSNFFSHENKLPKSFYDGTTGILPFDETVKNVLNYSYSHHIERLMILGNIMCLCEIHPDLVYKWFMENFIDSYDWVMVPNVYGMSQYADGGLITTKPYVSSSNYILKMSDYKKGDWCEVWDGLFWRFLHKNYAKIATNPRLSLLLKSNSFEKVAPKIKIAEKYLKHTF